MNLAGNIEKLFEAMEDLQKNYPNKQFTLDGKLVGDIGEILVQENYNVKLYSKQEKQYDGYDSENRKIQIKATFKDALTFPCDKKDVPDYYIGLKINRDGSFEEVYNGKGSDVWKLVENRKKTKNSTFRISLTALRKINVKVDPFDKIERRNDWHDVPNEGSSWYVTGSRETNDYLKIIEKNMIVEKIMNKYKNDFNCCNLTKDELAGKFYDKDGWIYFKAEKYYRFNLRIKEFARK